MLTVITVDTNQLQPYSQNARTHSKRQISQIAQSIRNFGFNNPILVDGNNVVIAGHGRLMAAKSLAMKEVPIIRLENLTEAKKKAYILADNKLAEKAGWDKEIIQIELQNLLNINVDFDLTQTGFETPEIDLLLNAAIIPANAPSDAVPDAAIVPARVQKGDLWKLGNHYVYCGDALDVQSYITLLGNKKADLIFTDPPYNVRIDKNVSGHGSIKHEEFAFASGEMSPAEFSKFLMSALFNLSTFSKSGSIHYVCMDWRHIDEVSFAGKRVYSELKNVCVWNKQLGAMGSLYRSQHELVFVFKNGTDPHINNIELGKYGRTRTNVWDYYGAAAGGSGKEKLKFHPTVKPIQLVADAIIDCSRQGGLILDCFGGSGSTLLAAERTKRCAYLIEYETKYCDVILYRYERMTKQKAELVGGSHVQK